ncbi:MAG: ABC transporter ATP-binding protein [Lachnospiraceae bacterium]
MKGETTQEYVLKTEHLTKIYNKKKVVNDVSIHVKKGDIYGFIGKNGAGKTTCMRMVAGLAAPNGGEIELFGSKDVEKHRIRIGTLIEEPGIYPGMTAAENLEVLRRSFGVTEKDRISEVLQMVGLEGVGKKKVKSFSMGMKQRLGIAMALFRNPDFLILDEPINGLDPEGIQQIRQLLLKLNREQDVTIMISSHILGELSKIATTYGIIRSGELVDEFSAEELYDRCRRCQKLVVSDVGLATHTLEEKLQIKDYDVPQDSQIRVFEQLDRAEEINRCLIEAGVNLRESYIAGQDLEGYFMELLGDK